jgi:hypothetical protein
VIQLPALQVLRVILELQALLELQAQQDLEVPQVPSAQLVTLALKENVKSVRNVNINVAVAKINVNKYI